MGRSRHLFLLFFLSGISGLVYESLWSRYLKLFVGSAATAQILVLALFMGGMSLGSLLAGRFSARIRKPVLAYGLVEGLIGLYALAFPYLYDFATRLCYDQIFPAVGGGGVGLVKWTCAGLLIAVPCTLLGTTFPLMSVGILRRDRERSGEILSFLYFSNSFGASLGALLSGFLLVPQFGLPGTLVVAAFLNLAIMAVCLRERGRDADDPLGTTAGKNTDSELRLGANREAIAAAEAENATYLYIIAWADAAVTQGVIARFRRDGGLMGFGEAVLTGDEGWEVCATGVNYNPGSGGPPLDVVNAQIQICNVDGGNPQTSSVGWVDEVGTAFGAVAVGEDNTTPYAGGPQPGNEFPLVCQNVMPAEAKWMWFNWDPQTVIWPQTSPFLWPGGQNPDHQFLIFRLAADLIPNPQ
ncbi:MAG: fused MFS/spermidine synthase [Myxococcales bacterium]|nr:fused MFS/spermidine synthase [Myxococcales bacterium]